MILFAELWHHYSEIHSDLISNVEMTEIENKVNNLSSWIFRNSFQLASTAFDYSTLYQSIIGDLKLVNTRAGDHLIGEIERIEYRLRFHKIASDQRQLINWLNEEQKEIGIQQLDFLSNPERVVMAFDALKKSVKPPVAFQSEFDKAISDMVVSSLGLKNKTFVEVSAHFKSSKLCRIQIFAHIINAKELPMKDLGFTVEELMLMAPYLGYVDCRNVPFKDEKEIQNFIKSCSSAYLLWLISDKITELKELPGTLRNFSCGESPSLRVVSLSNLPFLKRLTLYNNGALSEFSLSNCPLLESVSCERHPFTTLSLSNLPSLKVINCGCSSALRDITLSNLPWLKRVGSQSCPSLRRLALFNTPQLERIHSFSCGSLETIVSDGLPRCQVVDCQDCPNLRQLPQLPPDARVTLSSTINHKSFEVEPDDLKKHPLDVLGHLGEVLLEDKLMPNIVYLHSPGVDVGGLRRQLVTTLLKNLFQQEDSPILLLKTVEGVFPLLEKHDEKQAKAFKALGALIAFAAMNSLPLGRFLHPGFFFALRSMKGEQVEPFGDKVYKLALYGDPAYEAEESVKPVALPLFFAAQGFKEFLSERDLYNISQLTSGAFVDQVAGEEITWKAFENLATYNNDTNGRTKEYFRTFFTKYEKNPESLADMIELFTSSRALGKEEIKIYVDETLNKEMLFTMATCFQQVTVPAYATYGDFERKLLATIKHTLGEFGKA